MDQPLSSLTPAACQARYDALVDGPARRGKPLAVASHQQLLRYARGFLAWCQAEGKLRANPAATVRPVGQPRAGKEQLRIDEAQRWLAEALRQAEGGDVGAAAAATALLLCLRVGAVLSRTVRDLDAGGTVLWLPGGTRTKRTAPSKAVPERLRPHLLRLAEGRPPDAPLFPCPWKTTLTAVIPAHTFAQTGQRRISLRDEISAVAVLDVTKFEE